MPHENHLRTSLFSRVKFNAASISAAVLLLLACPPPALARWYQVEVIAFRQPQLATEKGEQFRALSALPDFGRTVDLIYPLPELDDEPAPAEADGRQLPTAFESIDSSEMRLSQVKRSLERSGRYEVMLAVGWRQPSYGVRRARQVFVSNVNAEMAASREQALQSDVPLSPEVVETPALEVEGMVSIRVSRLLHVALDFLYYRDGMPIRLAETRRLKLYETHYFDHPLFGLIVQVSPYALPKAAPDEVVSDDGAPTATSTAEPEL